MPYPEQYGFPFETVGTMRIVDVAAALPRSPEPNVFSASHPTAPGKPKYSPARHAWCIRKLLLHHHAGSHKETDVLLTSGPHKGIPRKMIDLANMVMNGGDSYQGTYAYHYDIGFQEHTDGGFDIVFRTQHETDNSWHTGTPNSIGLGISQFGGLREPTFEDGEYFAPDGGRPSAFQRRCLPAVVAHLQTKHEVSDLHVGGHFQYEKRMCPGWDTEFWVMHREERPRREGRAFCWPINPDGSNKPAFIPNDVAKSVPQAKRLLANVRAGGSGLYPVSRYFTWHDGAHLFGKTGQHVHAVRDGWIVAARMRKSVADDAGNDFGSANFVLILHEDPGLYDPLDKRTWETGRERYPVPLRYFSLYMHLAPLDLIFPWLDRLTNRDLPTFSALTTPGDKAVHIAGISVPVKAGEVIGVIGTHNPFAGRAADAPAASAAVYAADKHSVLHFEMFSSSNLVERFNPDPELHKQWTISDAVTISQPKHLLDRLDKLTGLSAADKAAIRAAVDAAEKADPTQQDVSAWTTQVTPAIDNALSKVIAKHTSEWHDDWAKIIDARAATWKLDAAAKAAMKKRVAAFQWWKQAYVTHGQNNLHNALNTWLPKAGVSHHYHPIRLLTWLAGLRRVLDHAPTGGIDASGYPVSTSILADMPLDTKVLAEAAASTKVVSLPKMYSKAQRKDKAHAKNWYKSVEIEEARLTNSSLRFASHRKVYEIESATKKMKGTTFVNWEVTLKEPLAEKVKASSPCKLGNYGWHFEADFDWNTDLSS